MRMVRMLIGTWSPFVNTHATLNSHDRSWGPARHTALTWSQLGPARHTELKGSRLRSGARQGRGGRRRGEGRGQADIKSNNPHLTGGEKRKKNKLLYFEWSPPWHVGWRLSGEGCHWEYDGKNGEFENIDFRFPWLSDTSEMGFGHDVPFLNYSDRLPHPSDLCQPDRVRWG